MFSSEILALGGKLHSHKVLSYISLKLPRVWANLLWRGEATLGAIIFPSKQAVICALLASWGRKKEYQFEKGSFSETIIFHTQSHTATAILPILNIIIYSKPTAAGDTRWASRLWTAATTSRHRAPRTHIRWVNWVIFQHSKMSFPIWNRLQRENFPLTFST